MIFSEKLILLMDITKASNKDLASYLHVDPSMISQIRTNRRKVSAKGGHLERMAKFFAQRIGTEYQQIAVADSVGIDRDIISDDVSFWEKVILEWILDENDTIESHAGNISQNTINKNNNPNLAQNELNVLFKDCKPAERAKLYKTFLEYLKSLDHPVTLYLESDEPIEWLTDNDEIQSDISELMYNMTGDHQIIQILNPISKADTFMEELKLWMPIILTGKSQVYCYPRFQDTYIRKTRYYIENELLYRSESSADKSYYASLTTDSVQMQIVGAQIKDFLKMCKPATFLHSKERDIFNCFSYYARANADRVAICSTLVPDSLPFSDVLSYMKDHNEYKSQYKLLQKLYDDYDYISMNRAYEMCRLATAEEVKAGKVQMLMPGRKLDEGKLYYTPELYVIHLKNIVHLLKTNDNYHFYPYNPRMDKVVFLVYEGIGALITDPSRYDGIVEFRTSNIVNAINEFAYQVLHTLPREIKDRKTTIETIERLITEIEK